MHLQISKYKILLPLILCLMVSSKSFSTQVKDTIVTIKQLQYTALKALETENFMEAVKNLNDANKLATLPKYRSYKPDVELNIAELYYNLEYFDKAADEAEKALNDKETSKNQYKLAKAYNLYGIILISKGESANAEKYLRKADSVYAIIGDEKNMANVQYGKGLLELRLGNYDKAIEFFKTAAKSFKEQNLTYQEAVAYSYLADALSLIDPKTYPKPIEEAKSTLKDAVTIARNYGYSKLLVDSHRINSQILIAQKQGA